MIKRTVFLSLAAALLLPAGAVAKKVELQGPLAIAGKGPLRADVTMADPAESKPVLVRGRGGFIRVVDLGGDLKVRCQGRGKSQSRQNEQGQTVFVCAGRGGRAAIAGSHFKLVAFAMRYQIAFPEGTSGTLQGRFRACDASEQACGARSEEESEEQQDREDGRNDRAEQLKERVEQLKERVQERKERATPEAHTPAGE